MSPCLQVRVSQRLAELARRPPVPVRISGRQVTEGPALGRHLQGLIQQLSSTGEAEYLTSLPAQCLVLRHAALSCCVLLGLTNGAVVAAKWICYLLHLVFMEASLGDNPARCVRKLSEVLELAA